MSGLTPPSNASVRRDVGFFGLLWTSVGSVIGSGWLFSGFAAASIAGPSAILAWVIGGAIMMLLALVFAELGGMLPISGGPALFPTIAFGGLAGATFSWFSYLQAAAVAPIEAIATLSYLSSSGIGVHWVNAQGHLTGTGILVASALILVFVTVNLFGIRWMARTNSTMTVIKVAVPIITIIVLLSLRAHPENLHAAGGFFAGGQQGGLHAILYAVPAGGVVFGLLGFEQCLQLGGEARQRGSVLPRAVLLAVAIGVVIYIAAQLAFLLALDPAALAKAGTWTNLGSNKELASAPFATLAALAGLGWLAWVLRADAVVSPSGTTLIYLTTTSRISLGAARSGYAPRPFERTSERRGVPVVGILGAAVVGILLMLPFPSWAKLVSVLTSATVMMYAAAPLALAALRRNASDLPRPNRLPAASWTAPAAFIAASFVVYWAGWQTYSALMAFLVIGWSAMAITLARRPPDQRPASGRQALWWLLAYFIGMGVISYLGSFGPGGAFGGVGPFAHVLIGGRGTLSFGWDLAVVAIFSLMIFVAAMRGALGSDEVSAETSKLADLAAPPGGEPSP